MKNFLKILKIFAIILVVAVLAIYAIYLFVLPNAINLNKYNADISKMAKDMVNLDIDVKNIKLKTSWNLDTKLVLDDVAVKYLSGKKLVSAKRGEAGIKLRKLALLQIELAPIVLDEPKLIIRIEKDGRYDVEKYLSELLEKQTQEQEPAPAEQSTGQIPVKISEVMPDVVLNNYNIRLKDTKSGDVLAIVGKEFKISDFKLNDKIKITTSGELLVNDKKHVAYDVNVSSFLPEVVETESNEAFEIPQITYNPIPVIKKYNFGANIDTDLKITQKDKDILLKGHLNTTELNYKIQGQNLDKSFLKLAFDGDKVDIKSNLYVDKDQKFTIDGLFKNGKKQTIDLKILSDRIDLVDIQRVAIALLDIANIKNDIEKFNITGYLDANFNVKSDMKKLESSGNMKIGNASLRHSSLPLTINSVKSDLDFNNNKITIKDTSALVNGSLFNAKGVIDTDANANLTVTAEKLPLNLLYNAFAPVDMKKTLKINGGTLSLDALVKGQLASVEPKINLKLNGLKVRETALKTGVGVNSILVDLTANTKGEYKGTAKATGSTLTLDEPKTTLSMPLGELDFDTKDITIKPSNVKLDNSTFAVSGIVKDYVSKMNATVNVNGKFASGDVLKYVPKEYRSFVKTKGLIPVLATVTSDGKNTKISAQSYATAQNYISVLDINRIAGKPSIVNVDIDTDGTSLKINDIAMYGLNSGISFGTNYKSNISNAVKIAGLDGKIGGLNAKVQNLQNLRVYTPSAISAKIPNMANSSVALKADMTMNGPLTAPVIKGSLSVPALNAPVYKVSAKNAAVDFTKDVINAKCPTLNLNGSQIALDTSVSTNFGKYTTIKNLTVNSEYVDVDKLFEIMTLLPQAEAAPGASVPVIIQKGHGNLAKIKSGTIIITNASGDFVLKNNIFKLTNMKATAYNGAIVGNVDYNVPYETTKAVIQGRGLNSTTALEALSGLKDQIKGSLDFDADVSLIGATYEQQMKTLKGTVNFSIGAGQMGSLGVLEHFIYASNLLSQKFAQSNLNSVVQTLAPKNTGRFNYLKGHLTFANGWATLNPVHSGGPQMSMYLTGKFNLLNNYAKIEILGRVAREIVNVMGPVGDMSINKLLGSSSSNFSNFLNNYNIMKDEKTIAKIPQLVPESADTKAFQVIIDGNIEKPTSVRTFKWVATESEVAAAKAAISKQIQSFLPTKVQDALNKVNTVNTGKTTPQTTATPASKTTSTPTVPTSQTAGQAAQNASNQLKDAAKNAVNEQLKKALPNFWDKIE